MKKNVTKSKKIALIFSLALFLTGALPAQETQTSDAAADSTQASATEEAEQNPSETAENTETKQDKKSDGKKAKKNQTQLDRYLGTVYVPVKKYELVSENFGMVFNSKNGTFNFYAENEKGKKYPVLSETGGSVSSSFFLKTGDTVWRLNKNAGVKKELRKTGTGAQLAYTIEKTARVVLDFSFTEPVVKNADSMTDFDYSKNMDLASGQKTTEAEDFKGIIKLTVYVTNLSSKTSDFAVKALFDTILGEGLDYHFELADGSRVTSELQLGTMENARAFTTTDLKTSMQVVLNGYGVASSECVTFSNISNLNKGRWIPAAENGRSFNSVNAYNNSAAAIVWPQKKLAPEKTYEFHFFIGLAADSRKTYALDYTDYISDSLQKTSLSAESSSAETESDFYESESEGAKRDVDFEVQKVTEKQLELEYIQDLMNRIDALESSETEIDRNEIRMLNAELDAILATLRHRN